MKKVSLIITAVALTIGVSQAFAGNTSHKGDKAHTIFQYTNGQGDSVITASRTTAQLSTGCTGSVSFCANAWTTGFPATRESAFDIRHVD